MGLSVILVWSPHRNKTPLNRQQKIRPPPQVMLIIVETNGTLVREIQVCISPLAGGVRWSNHPIFKILPQFPEAFPKCIYCNIALQ